MARMRCQAWSSDSSERETEAQVKIDEKRRRIMPAHAHGLNGYTNYGCRCGVCREANADHHYRRHEHRGGDKAGLKCGLWWLPCNLPEYALGLCRPHYERRRTGRPFFNIRIKPKPMRRKKYA
jgi:hypothetical protein